MYNYSTGTQDHWFEDDNEIDLESFNELSPESCADNVGNETALRMQSVRLLYGG